MVNDVKSWVLSYLTALGTDYVLGERTVWTSNCVCYCFGVHANRIWPRKEKRTRFNPWWSRRYHSLFHKAHQMFIARLKEKYRQAKSEESKMGTCFHCEERKERKDLKVCGICKWGQYCSQACQKAAWPEHKNDALSVKSWRADCLGFYATNKLGYY